MRVAVLALVLALPAAATPRDPFAPYGGPDDDVIECIGVLRDADLGAIRLTGVVVGTASPTALVQAPDGTSAALKVGTVLSRAMAEVKAIRRDRVVVETFTRDAAGVRRHTLHELKLARR